MKDIYQKKESVREREILKVYLDLEGEIRLEKNSLKGVTKALSFRII